MNSFNLTAIGNLAGDPEMMSKDNVIYTRFCLIASDYAGKDSRGVVRTLATSVWFVAFGGLGEAIATNARKGDQLIVRAQLRSNNRPDRGGDMQYGYSFIAQGFRFGAPGRLSRAQLDKRRGEDAVVTLGGAEEIEASA